jgi:hypothetical protein
MSYGATCALISNLVCIPIFVLLIWQLKLANWPKIALVIPAIALPDLDHFVLTNMPGFGVHPLAGQKILHIGHTIEIVTLEIVVFLVFFIIVDPIRQRNLRSWAFPLIIDYSGRISYSLAWLVRILLLGLAIHWIQDLIIYTVFKKWTYLHISLLSYLLG